MSAPSSGEPSLGLAFGGLTKDGLIQERMRFPGAKGNELMRTVASRVTNHTPSHYAMLGVPRDFTDEQLRKQYRLLALRFHPDAAARHGIDEQEAVERFRQLLLSCGEVVLGLLCTCSSADRHKARSAERMFLRQSGLVLRLDRGRLPNS